MCYVLLTFPLASLCEGRHFLYPKLQYGQTIRPFVISGIREIFVVIDDFEPIFCKCDTGTGSSHLTCDILGTLQF